MPSTLYFIRLAAATLLAAMIGVAPALRRGALGAGRARDRKARRREEAVRYRHAVDIRQARHWDPQETPEPDIGNRLGGESRFTLSMDIAHDRARYDWVRFRIAPMKRTFIYSEVFADGVGYVLGEDNIVLSRQAKETNPSLHTMSASRVIANRRELHRMSPRLLLEMQAHPDRLVGAAG